MALSKFSQITTLVLSNVVNVELLFRVSGAETRVVFWPTLNRLIVSGAFDEYVDPATNHFSTMGFSWSVTRSLRHMPSLVKMSVEMLSLPNRPAGTVHPSTPRLWARTHETLSIQLEMYQMFQCPSGFPHTQNARGIFADHRQLAQPWEEMLAQPMGVVKDLQVSWRKAGKGGHVYTGAWWVSSSDSNA